MLKRILIILSVIALTMGYAFYQKKSLESQLALESNPTSVLKKLPESTFETLESTPYIIADQQFELLVVHFWGTWCAPCEAELPELLTFIKQFEGRPGVKFLLVAVNDEVVKINKHLKGMELPAGITWLLDNKDIHRTEYGTTRVPETYVFSSDKTLLRKFLGPQIWKNPTFFQTFDEFYLTSTRKL